MSPRFDRRPDKRAGSGGSSASRSPRPGASRPGSSARPAASRYQSRRDDGLRPERRSGERPSSDRRSPERQEGDRRAPERRFSEQRFPEPRFSEPRFGASRFGERRPQPGRAQPGRPQERRSTEGRSIEGRSTEGRSPEGRFSSRSGGGTFSSRFSRSGERRPGERRPGAWTGGERMGSERAGGERWSSERRSGERRPSERSPLVAGPLGGGAPGGDAQTHAEETPSDLIWGRHPALAALESGRPVHRIWCTPEMRFSPKFLQLLREAKASGVLVEEVTWARLGQITGGAVHQGIVLQTAAAETLDLPSLIEGCRQLGEAPVLMALDGITDPHNLGAIVRSAEALGAHGVVLPQRRSAGLTGSAAKVAAGALEHLPVARVVNLNRALDSLKQEGYRVIGLAGEGTVTLEEADLDGPLVIVTGSEGEGLSMLTRRHCDQLVRIPLRGSTPSLNASVATALLLYEVARRGWMKGLRGSQPAPRISRPQLPTIADAMADGAADGMAAVLGASEPVVAPGAEREAAPGAMADAAADDSAEQANAELESAGQGSAAQNGEEPDTAAPDTDVPQANAAAAAEAGTISLSLEPPITLRFEGNIQL